jgi:GNAT superfamily N-acetyltransferase
VIHNVGRADQVDREGRRRLVSSISRFSEPAATLDGTGVHGVEIVDSCRFGGAFVFDAPWRRLGIGKPLRQSAAGRCLDVDITERVLFALVANRCLEPSSKLAALRWAAERVASPGVATSMTMPRLREPVESVPLPMS